MLFVLIILVFSFIEFISVFGDINTKEEKQDAKDWERLTGNKYE